MTKNKRPHPDWIAENEIITGILRMHPRGFGFVVPDSLFDCPGDVFIPKHLTDNAVDGDHVEIQVNPDSNWEKGPEGRVISIMKRGRTHLAGTIREISSKGKIHAYVPLLGLSKSVLVKPRPEEKTLKVGDRVIMKVLDWGDTAAPAICEVSYYIGHISDPSCDVPAAIEEYDLRNLFSKKTLNEVKAIGNKVTKKDLHSRKDFSKSETFTIDPETAKDYDDALSISKDKKGNYHLGVHIADVAHYVKQHSNLDTEAYARCNSVYFPGTVVPMLPHELSDNLCSLRENQVRLTVSVMMDFDPKGTLLGYQIFRSFIKSKKRMTYPEAKLILDKEKESVHLKSLQLMVELCHLLKEKRSERGSIDFALPEMVIEVDAKGMPTGTRKVEYDITHQLVEEFMLKANELVAKNLTDRGKPVLYRIHEAPSPENIEEFLNLARSLGFQLPKNPDQKAIQKLFYKAKKTAFGQQLSVGFIRSMKLAIYSPENVGHFGLALEYYCHFTSPIRRYSDLVTQRLLFDEEDEKLDLKEVALKCSEQERIAFRAESSVKLLKKLRLLNVYLHENPDKVFKAMVTRIKPFGLTFELQEFFLEGFLHISEIGSDYYIYEPKKPALIGKHSGKTYTVGETIAVRLKAVDFIILESKWEMASRPKAKGKEKGKSRRQEQKGRKRRPKRRNS
ncbi:MAG TPA: VacB/RNase II family 3'-5' exoribonuclease [Rhabdochlamydiaceae bacterium]|nr:VacB/RNase II family 3'-5' exoribonuclease [Rhabdochlamydiaceae bacterium]